MSNPVKSWFGASFTKLDPLIQKIHLHGGVLEGNVRIFTGSGLAGVIGKRLAKKIGVPTEKHIASFKVSINHTKESLLWDRTFNDTEMKSVFTPHKSFPNGYWTEDSSGIRLKLTVRIKDGGWHWVQQGISVKGIPMPLWLFPKTTAYKTISNGKYLFSVSFSLPLLGKLLSYSGELKPS